MARAALLLLLAACGGTTVTQSDCDRVFLTTCDHQVECGLAPDFQSCHDDLDLSFVCDFSKTKDEFKACHASDPGCGESVSEECYSVLCSKALGCGIETVAGGSGTRL